jgi:outer membrane lipoprotein-sorting protein
MKNITLFFKSSLSQFKLKDKLNIKVIISSLKHTWFLFMLVSFFSCQTIGYKYSDTYNEIPHVENEALLLFSNIKNTNQSLETFKGIGKLKLNTNKKSMNLRAAFMGTQQGKFRVEIFGFPGQSSARYINDGHTSYVYLPFEDQLYAINSANPSLEKLLNLPITSNDLNSFLSGKIPIDDYTVDHISVSESGKEYEIYLTKSCLGDRKKIYIDLDRIQRCKIEVFNLFGSLKYRALLDRIQAVDEYRIPFEIHISDNNGNGLHIHIDKYWTNTSIPASSFTLTHPY